MSEPTRHAAAQPAVSVVIPTHGQPRYLARQLAALAGQRAAAPFEVIVADNGAPGLLTSLADFRDRLDLRVVDATARPGPGYARNRGVRSARGPAVVFLDDDDEAGPGYVDAMAHALRSHKVVSARLDMRTLNARWIYEQKWASPLEEPTPDRPPSTIAAAMGVDRASFDEVGGFDEQLRTGYYEDIDLCWRLGRLGHEIVYVPDAVLHYRLRSRGHALARKARYLTLGAAQFTRKYPEAATEPVSLGSGLRYVCGSALRAAAGPTPQMRAEGWCGLGICLGHAEVAVRRRARRL